MSRHYWLFKTEPTTFGLAHLQRAAAQTSGWDGVRNYQARNYLRDEVQVGDGVLFYHSGTAPVIVALCRVVRGAYPDATQFDRGSAAYDPKATPAAPRWYAVDVQLERALPVPLPLARLRTVPALAGLALLRPGQRLSIQPVSAAHWAVLLQLGGLASAAGPRPRRGGA